MRADDLRIDALQRVVGDAQPLGLIATQIVEPRIGRAHQLVEYAARLRVLQVEREAALVAVERLEEMAVARPEVVRADRAADVAALRRVLDLDHLGAEVAQQHAAERPSPVLLDRDDADAGKREHVRSLVYGAAWQMRSITGRTSAA